MELGGWSGSDIGVLTAWVTRVLIWFWWVLGFDPSVVFGWIFTWIQIRCRCSLDSCIFIWCFPISFCYKNVLIVKMSCLWCVPCFLLLKKCLLMVKMSCLWCTNYDSNRDFINLNSTRYMFKLIIPYIWMKWLYVVTFWTPAQLIILLFVLKLEIYWLTPKVYLWRQAFSR